MPFIAPAGTPASITVTLDEPGLNVGYTQWDDSGSSPVQITGQIGQVNGVWPALNFIGNSYRVQIPGIENKWYLIQKAVYTDETYTEINTNEPQGDDTVFFEEASGGSGTVIGQVITGYITNKRVTGYVPQ